MSFINIIRTAGNVQGVIGRVRNFADSILSLFGVDVVGVFDATSGKQIFESARPMKANVIRSQKIMDHPIETGSVVSDFAVIMPVEMELSMMLTGEERVRMYQSISSYFSQQVPVTVHTNAGVWENMLIQAMPHEETPEIFDALPVALKFREVQFVEVQYQSLPPAAVQQTTDQSTVDRGVQQPKESALFQIAKFAKGLF